MLVVLVLAALVASSGAHADDECVAAARRITAFLIEEAKGTRHEAEIQSTIEQHGSSENAIVELAKTFDPDECAFVLAASDSTIRTLAISMLPDRNGQ